MHTILRRPVLAAALAGMTLLAGCDADARPTSDQSMNHKPETSSAEADAEVGFPATPNYTEKRLVKMLIEMRDNPHLSTVTYGTALDGHLVKRCDSIGYGISAATQYTSPSKTVAGGSSQSYALTTVPQADPNGLFSPSSTEGTWVICVNPKTHQPAPVYMEERITVSPFDLS